MALEMRIKTGEDLVCEYTGRDATVLVKLKGDHTDETCWIGRSAIEEAYKLLDAMDPKHQRPLQVQPAAPDYPQEHHGHHILPPQRDLPEPAQLPPPQVQQRGALKDNPELVKRFEKSLIALIEDPPPNHKDDGQLSEQHVRDLIHLHKVVFQQPMENMFPVVARHLGMDRGRFEMILASKGSI